MLLQQHIVGPGLPVEAAHLPDDFRTDRLYCREVDDILRKHVSAIDATYFLYGSSLGGAPRSLGLADWLKLCADAQLTTRPGADVTLRRIRTAFFRARMVVVDEVKDRRRFLSLARVEFMEALGRLADMATTPTDDDMLARGVDPSLSTAVMAYEKIICREGEAEARRATNRPSSEFLFVPKTTALSERLDRFLCLLFGRLALRSKGVLNAGTGEQCRLVPRYLTGEMLMTWSG